MRRGARPGHRGWRAGEDGWGRAAAGPVKLAHYQTRRPVVLPGETLEIKPIKEGKEHYQSVAYLDDGTMVVVDGGRRRIGQTLSVTITSVLQTQAGRMIFARPSDEPGH